MNRRGFTIIELLVAIAVLSVILALALQTVVLSDRLVLRGQSRLRVVLDRAELQSQVRQDIWAAEAFIPGASPDAAQFTMPDAPMVVYSASSSHTSRTSGGVETLYNGVVEFTQGDDGLIEVRGQDTGEWTFAARMRNAGGESQ